jgi:hypothetical protein
MFWECPHKGSHPRGLVPSVMMLIERTLKRPGEKWLDHQRLCPWTGLMKFLRLPSVSMRIRCNKWSETGPEYLLLPVPPRDLPLLKFLPWCHLPYCDVARSLSPEPSRCCWHAILLNLQLNRPLFFIVYLASAVFCHSDRKQTETLNFHFFDTYLWFWRYRSYSGIGVMPVIYQVCFSLPPFFGHVFLWDKKSN